MKKSYFLLTVIFTLILLVCCKSLQLPSYNLEILGNHLISVDRATEIKNRYQTERIDLLENQLKDLYNNDDFRDSKFAWLPLDKMKAYVAYIESIKVANPEENVSGIRLYFATYPNNVSGEKYPGQQTFFMVPTVKTDFNDTTFETMNHLPFVIQPNNSSTPLKGEFIILDELMQTYKRDVRYSSYHTNNNEPQRTGLQTSRSSARLAQGEVTKTILNEFNLAPPPE